MSAAGPLPSPGGPPPAGAGALGSAGAGPLAGPGPFAGPGADPGRAPSVTGVFVRLKLALVRNGLRQSRGRTVGWVLGVVFALLYALGLGAGMIALRGNEYAPVAAVTLAVVCGLCWAVMPLFFFGGDDTLDPTRLAMLPLRPRPLITALTVSSLIGVGPVVTALVSAGAVVAVAHSAAGATVGVLAVALVVLTCVAVARAVAAANTRLLTSRKGRDLALLSGVVIAVGAQVANVAASALSSGHRLRQAGSLTDVLRWIPPAPAVDAVRSASRGAYGLAVAQLVWAAVAVVLLLRWWHSSLRRLMVSPDASTLQAAADGGSRAARGGRPRGLAATLLTAPLPRRLVAGRTGTVMERQFRYLWRDPRSRASLTAGVAVGLLLPLAAVVQHGSVYQCLWAAGLLGLQMYNQFGTDGSAFWTVAATIATRSDAAHELRGRALTLTLIAVPYVTVVTAGAALLLGRPQALPETLGLGLAYLGALIATGAYASVRYPYAVQQDHPFQNAAPGQTGLVVMNVLGGTVVGGALTLPVLALTVGLHLSGEHALLWTVLPVGAVYGAALGAAAVRFTAPRLLDRLPEILAVVARS
ncbi:transporter [Actinacidiphila sp. DG2A-62]|uniref:transporter n=1 Tax=Actinacidiphila sp. DG2A-62 TaxID=3108821 RepID=UPI002DB7615F|nr:transporter [Actinacidiphila sp. DG2A-62]MEC3994715.1 transporter [Actinacidiphila sp. DG2A-62]